MRTPNYKESHIIEITENYFEWYDNSNQDNIGFIILNVLMLSMRYGQIGMIYSQPSKEFYDKMPKGGLVIPHNDMENIVNIIKPEDIEKLKNIKTDNIEVNIK